MDYRLEGFLSNKNGKKQKKQMAGEMCGAGSLNHEIFMKDVPRRG
jgi:hypothetical protein